MDCAGLNLFRLRVMSRHIFGHVDLDMNSGSLTADRLTAQSVAQQQGHCRMCPERLQAG